MPGDRYVAMGYLRFRRLPPFVPVFSVSVSTCSSRTVSGSGTVGVAGFNDTKPRLAAASISGKCRPHPAFCAREDSDEAPGRFPRDGT